MSGSKFGSLVPESRLIITTRGNQGRDVDPVKLPPHVPILECASDVEFAWTVHRVINLGVLGQTLPFSKVLVTLVMSSLTTSRESRFTAFRSFLQARGSRLAPRCAAQAGYHATESGQG